MSISEYNPEDSVTDAAPVPRAMFNELVKRVEALEKDMAEHRHGYRWEAVGRNYEALPSVTVGDPVLTHSCNTPTGPECWCER